MDATMIEYLRDLEECIIMLEMRWVRVDLTLPCTPPSFPRVLSFILIEFSPASSPFARACIQACQVNSSVHIIIMTRAEFDRVFNNIAMKWCVIPYSFSRHCVLCTFVWLIVHLHRMHRFAMLAMSLSSPFDTSSDQFSVFLNSLP